ncbi:TPA: BREX-1 system adenine-specific DNA-methyltransferase PglX [Vibrio parahaemolyticus]|nr:BREX-1 system adenine-specific DNA-methyltransferase PglX [Vibrio parahaemolyticus]EGR1370684.1 BREX-1 system adenine-specific DNA-methyltransferase PglX [Vibrio parahaemolyticus]ELZ1478169.1 BREX-1 system adenine-specific DNA-methyltransferase PglX [Vibrio parahaemolyticus]
MNTNNIKKYAPKARREFMDAVAKRLNTFGITANKKGELQIAEAKLQGSVLQIAGNSFDGKLAEPRKRIVARSQKLGYAQLIEQVAYTWFNRLCAIRYMEIHDYLGHGFRVLSHPDNPKSFEIIDHAQDAADELGLDRSRIVELKLAGNKDEELYRELLLGQCHKLHEAMPFLFDALDDETELLLPDNLTRTDSILRGLVDGIPEEDWQQVEVIGWLYQFYISEKKDQVMGKVVKSEDIPAATQLFTPNWIVKYLVQNSVGRQWLQTYPESAIKTQMEYYIEPAEQSDEVNQQIKAITPESIEPETIKVLDPACGSGHILIEAYNVLKAIYEERGFRSRDIPKMILEHNLYGLDIDDRAAQLSGFALMMMARDDDKRIFTRNVRLNVLSLQESNHIDLPTLWKALNLSGSWQSGTSQGLFSDDEQDLSSFNADNRYQLLKRTLARFTQAKTFGSLIDVPSDEHEQLKELLSTLVELQESGDSMQKPAAKQLIEIVHQALVLSIRYDAVIANPPYMGSKGMNAPLKDYVSKNFTDTKQDLYSCFMDKGISQLKNGGVSSFVVMHGWMFLSTFEKARELMLSKGFFSNMAHLGPAAFPGLSEYVVQTTAYNHVKTDLTPLNSKYIRLTVGKSEDKRYSLAAKRYASFTIANNQLLEINSKIMAYWLKDISVLTAGLMHDHAYSGGRIKTHNDETYVRCSWEVSNKDIGTRWSLFDKGGESRRWYGNKYYVVDWSDNARSFYSSNGGLTREEFWGKQGVCWTDINKGTANFRIKDADALYSSLSPTLFFKDNEKYLMGYLNSVVGEYFCNILNPSFHLNVGDVLSLPAKVSTSDDWVLECVDECISISKDDWNESELSTDFKGLNIVSNSSGDIESDVRKQVEFLKRRQARLIELETKINNHFALLYGLDSEVEVDVTSDKLTLFSNVCELGEEKYISEYCCKLISFAIGCLFGRFSVIEPGILFASRDHSEFISNVSRRRYGSLEVDEDGILPLTSQEWFKDDATNRFREFVKVVCGGESIQRNLDFVADSLCLNVLKPKKSESALETIRRYLSTQFYKDHLKTYKKRPIYWLFSSGKQKAFECLVYLHRYNEGTLSRMRTEYVTPLLGKYDAYAEQLEKQIETADSTSEANRFKKELDALIKKQVELREFDDKLKHYADMRISLDLDDGVKVNYGKFGDLLADVKAITGSAPEVN